MDKILKSVKKMQGSPKNVRFSDLEKVCQHYFGEPRNKGTSHHVYKTPWPEDPRVNKGGMAKVKQVLKAIEKIEEDHNG